MVPSVLVSSVCWSLRCLISTLTQGESGDGHFILGSLVQSRCGKGGTLQTNNTGVCSQCLSHTGPVLTHGTCALPAHTAQALGCSTGNCLEAGPGLHAPPRSKLLRFRHSGSPQRRRLHWACILCPSQVRAAQVMRRLASAVAATYRLSRPCCSVFWVYNWRTLSGGC